MTLSHFGVPFNEQDVRGICGIVQSTKDEDSIGCFGIGFKSVYSFTDTPTVHSGDEDFCIRDFVQPSAIQKVQREYGETLIVLPLREADTTAHNQIAAGLRSLGPRVLLFLRSISEIDWTVEDGESGFYVRNPPEYLDEHVRRIQLIGQVGDGDEYEQDWLVFDQKVKSPNGRQVGHVELAFSVRSDETNPRDWHIVKVASSPLVVFFPTALETNLGFLLQGPYRTTPSRDNVMRNDEWNKSLVEKNASLLINALRWLRDRSKLDASVLSCMPLDREKFAEASMFGPLFDAVHEAMTSEALLPRHGIGYVSASNAKLARTQELRDLFTPSQISALYQQEVSAWLTSDISPDRTPALRRYLLQEQNLVEVTPATLIPRLNRTFLESQPDDWILKFYEFLRSQGAVLRSPGPSQSRH